MSTRPTGRRTRAALALTALLGGAALAGLPATTAAAADGALAVQYRTGSGGATADQSEPWFKVRNTGSTTVQLSQVKIRYYFKADSASATYRFACSWAVKGCANVTGSFGTLANPTATADRYLEIGFTSGSLAPGASTGEIQLRLAKTDWSSFGQADDHSYRVSASLTDFDHVTAYTGGALAWGVEPR